MTRLVLCMKIPSEDNKLSKVVRDKECCNEPKPRNQRPCRELKTRKKREKPKLEDRHFKLDYFDPDLGHRERGKHWKQDYFDFDYGDHFNPRFKKPSVDFDELNESNSSVPVRHPKKKKIRRKNRRKMQNKTYRVIDESSETESFPTKYKIQRTDNYQRTDSFTKTDSFLPKFSLPSTINDIEKKDRKKDDMVPSKGATEELCSGPTTPICSISSESGCLTTLQVKNESQVVLPDSDIFLENVFVEHESTTCGEEKQDMVIEPADLGPRLDTGNNTAYKLVVIPIIPSTNSFPMTDYELQLLGDSGYWPVASRQEKILIFGDKMFKIISEASRRRTKPPVIEQEDV